jgi:hypothetical protein
MSTPLNNVANGSAGFIMTMMSTTIAIISSNIVINRIIAVPLPFQAVPFAYLLILHLNPLLVVPVFPGDLTTILVGEEQQTNNKKAPAIEIAKALIILRSN